MAHEEATTEENKTDPRYNELLEDRIGFDDQILLIEKIRRELTEGVNYLRDLWNAWNELAKLTDDVEEFDPSQPLKSNLIFTTENAVHTNLVTNENTVTFSKTKDLSDATVTALNKLWKDDSKKNDIVALRKDQMRAVVRRGVGDVEVYDMVDGVVVPKLVNQRSFYFNPDGISGQGNGKHKVGAYRYAGYLYTTTIQKIADNIDNYDITVDDMANFDVVPPAYELAEGWTEEMYDESNVEAVYAKRNDIDGKIAELGANNTAMSEELMKQKEDVEEKIAMIADTNNPIFVLRHYTFFKDRGVVVVDINSLNGKIIRYDELKDYDTLPFTTRQLFKKDHARNTRSIPEMTYPIQVVVDRIMNRADLNEELRLAQLILVDQDSITDTGAIEDMNDAILPLKKGATRSPKDSLQIVKRSEVDTAVYRFIDFLHGVNEETTGVSRQDRGLQPRNQYESATSAGTTARNAKKVDLSKIYSFIDDEKEMPMLVLKRYNSVEKGLEVALLRTNEAAKIDDSIIKEVKESVKVENISVANKMLMEIEREKLIQSVPFVMQQAAAFSGVLPINMEEIIAWGFSIYGMTEEQIDRALLDTASEELIKSEGIMLRKNKKVEVHEDDNDAKHIVEHRKLKQTKASIEHIGDHIVQMLRKAEQRRQQQQQQQLDNNQLAQSLSPGGAITGGQGGRPVDNIT